MERSFSEQRRRVLHFLSGGPARVRPAAREGRVLLEAAERGTIAVESSVLSTLATEGILVATSTGIVLSAQGGKLAERLASPADALQDRQREIDTITVASPTGPVTVMANLAESPLAQLVRRRTRQGTPFLDAREFQAGERLRADYTRGQIMPRLGANWVASVSSGRRASGGLADLTDAALGARQRVDDAIAAVGPELSGVLIDVCCFLKGLERVEVERGWPVRSAKVVLKTALGALARHYSPKENVKHRRERQTLHWGTEDYRPKIS